MVQENSLWAYCGGGVSVAPMTSIAGPPGLDPAVLQGHEVAQLGEGDEEDERPPPHGVAKQQVDDGVGHHPSLPG